MSLPPADGGLLASRDPPRRLPWFSSDQINQEYILRLDIGLRGVVHAMRVAP